MSTENKIRYGIGESEQGTVGGGRLGMMPDLEENAVGAANGKLQCDTQGSRYPIYVA